MKRILTTLLVAATMMTEASAQKTELIERGIPLYLADSLKLDSMYNYWNDFVSQHPKDDVAWRNLFEICSNQEFRLRCKNWEVGVQHFKDEMVPLLERIKKAIPSSYTAYYCEYEGSLAETTDRRELTADSAIVLLPKDAPAGDYELWTQYLIPKRDTVRITNVLTQYYESGQYPEESLQYHFNELQGMDEGGVYIAPHPGEMVGKLILQQKFKYIQPITYHIATGHIASCFDMLQNSHHRLLGYGLRSMSFSHPKQQAETCRDCQARLCETHLHSRRKNDRGQRCI